MLCFWRAQIYLVTDNPVFLREQVDLVGGVDGGHVHVGSSWVAVFQPLELGTDDFRHIFPAVIRTELHPTAVFCWIIRSGSIVCFNDQAASLE